MIFSPIPLASGGGSAKPDAIVLDAQHDRLVVAVQADRDVAGLSMLEGVGDRLAGDAVELRGGLVVRHVHRFVAFEGARHAVQLRGPLGELRQGPP